MAAATANGTTATKIATPGGEDDNVIWKGDTTTAVKRSSAGAGAQDPAAQWTITNNGQIFDPKSGSTWEIADEVLKLQISDDAATAPTEIAEKSSTTDNSPSGKGSTSALAPAIDLDKPSAPRQASADGDDVSSSDSSSLATPANRMPGSKIVNGNQKVKKEPFASNGAIPPYGTFDEGLYNPSLMGAPVPQSLPQHYPLPSGALPSPLMSGFPHHIQTMHGPVPPPLFSPHQIAPQTAMHDGSLGSGPRASNGQLASFAPMHDASLQHPLSPYSRPSYPGSPPPATPYSNPMSPTLSPTTYMSHPYPSSIHAPLNYPYGAPPMAATQSPGYEYLTGPLDDPRNPAMAGRSQFRGHQHSASDTAALRDPSGDVAGVNGAMGQTPSHSHSQSLTLSPYSPVPGSPYGPHSPAPYQSFYAALPPGHITQQQQDAINAMTRASPYATNGPPAAAYLAAIAAGVTDPAALALVQSGAGPSANNRKLGLYKTELCRSWEEKGSCRYGAKCQFAHGEDEIRKVSRHPKYKTEICRTFWVSGSCPYGKRCCFIHTELPAAGAPGAPPPNGDAQRPGSTGAPGAATTPAPANGNPTPGTDGRARSMSTNSDPNDAPSSLLARISAKAQANNAAAQAANRSSEASPANGSSYNQDQVTANAIAQAYAQYGRPASGALLPGNTETSTVVPDKFPTTNGNVGGHSGSGLGHHRVSASVDFSGHRTMADFSSPELGGGLGHQRNPSASAIHPQLSNFGQLMSSRVGQGGTRGSGDANGTPNRNSPSQGSRFSHERSQSGGVSRTVGSTFSTWAS